MKSKPYLMIGGGGHAAALAEILLKQNKNIIGVISPFITAGNSIFEKITHYAEDNDVFKFSPGEVLLVNGIGSMPYKDLRESVYKRFTSRGYKFASVIAKSSLVSDFSTLEAGVQIMNNCVVNIGCWIGENTIVNTSTSIDHDCTVGPHCHLAPGTVMSGQVTLENNVHIGTGAKIINNVRIGNRSIIGVGANITRSIPANTIVYGAQALVKGLDKNDS